MERKNEDRFVNNHEQNIGDSRRVLKPKKELPSPKLPSNESQYRLSEHVITEEESIEKAVRYLEKLNIGFDVKHADDIKDSSTQTSKTIIQLANLETGQMSPDSLSPTPRENCPNSRGNCSSSRGNGPSSRGNGPSSRGNGPSSRGNDPSSRGNGPSSRENDPSSRGNGPISRENCPDTNLMLNLEEPTKRKHEMVVPNSKIQSYNAMTYTRKSNVLHYLDSYDQDITCNESSQETDSKGETLPYPRCSLIETFLSSKSNSLRSHIKDEHPSDRSDDVQSGHSRFLEQTSPFKKLVQNKNFKSQSFVDPSYHDHRDPLQISRFTVKRVRPVDRQSPKYFCKPIPEVNLETASLNQEKCPALLNKVKYSPRLLYQSKRSNSFMSPTIASEQKSKQNEVRQIKRLISPTRRGRSVSPKAMCRELCMEPQQKIPYIDESRSSGLDETSSSLFKVENSMLCRGNANTPVSDGAGFKDNLMKMAIEPKYSEETLFACSQGNDTISSTSTENILFSILNRIRNSDWNVALKGIAEITELCRSLDRDTLYPHMTTVNQRLLELLRSPRSHVCRTACQAAGHLFESMKDTRRPEFDDIVDLLLFKTADANKFIRQDANLALDCMVTHIPIYHSVRALCVKGPTHKNHLVRTATVRLIICAVVIAGPSSVLNPNTSEHTRKRILLHMKKFIEDKHVETRNYGERLYKILCKEPYFDVFLKQYLEKEDIIQLKKHLRFVHKKT